MSHDNRDTFCDDDWPIFLDQASNNANRAFAIISPPKYGRMGLQVFYKPLLDELGK